ncbi:hypothetical protein SERLA73DRAFT_149240 [Serpula lacrymans var. lacrymans S7.3]|uniref:Uncharacterized protein n=1 Tax=Serpula lacrymans var. lacrymans (strain S7.3) TaxID=936435 RepID=F8PH20_SERL3|nr:hypothetical protein SERLA73DRAFT_149240 [Serpula lacrymans var. lacrymans S7.3]
MSEDPTTFLLKELHSTTPKTGQLEPSTTSPNDHENDENALALALWKDCPPPHAIDSDSSPQVPSKRPHDDNNPEVVSRTEATPQPPQSAEQATLPGTIASNKSITWQPINPIPNPQLQLQPQPQPQLPLQQQQQQQPQPQPQPQPQLQPQPNSQVLPWMNGAQGRANLLATMSAYNNSQLSMQPQVLGNMRAKLQSPIIKVASTLFHTILMVSTQVLIKLSETQPLPERL